MTNETEITPREIVAYYDATEIDYRLVHHLDRHLALHFGYWDEATKSLGDALRRENEVLAALARVDRASVVLDAGCGVGGSAIYLAETFGCTTVGIGLSEREIEQARNNARKRGVAHLTEFHVDDFRNSRFPDRSFDVVWAIESVCHANFKCDFLREAYRLLRPKGRLVVADGFAARENYTNEERELMRKWLSGWAVRALATSDGFLADLAQAGFCNIGFIDATAHIWRTSLRLYHLSFPGLLIGKVLEALSLRSRIQTGNIIAARYQYRALKRGLWKYGIVTAEKPR
jgi:cyclopropane fatty-acyl-phospholipid synthase-like methyltransferase